LTRNLLHHTAPRHKFGRLVSLNKQSLATQLLGRVCAYIVAKVGEGSLARNVRTEWQIFESTLRIEGLILNQYCSLGSARNGLMHRSNDVHW
jgi:hypothetical protein